MHEASPIQEIRQISDIPDSIITLENDDEKIDLLETEVSTKSSGLDDKLDLGGVVQLKKSLEAGTQPEDLEIENSKTEMNESIVSREDTAGTPYMNVHPKNDNDEIISIESSHYFSTSSCIQEDKSRLTPLQAIEEITSSVTQTSNRNEAVQSQEENLTNKAVLKTKDITHVSKEIKNVDRLSDYAEKNNQGGLGHLKSYLEESTDPKYLIAKESNSETILIEGTMETTSTVSEASYSERQFSDSSLKEEVISSSDTVTGDSSLESTHEKIEKSNRSFETAKSTSKPSEIFVQAEEKDEKLSYSMDDGLPKIEEVTSDTIEIISIVSEEKIVGRNTPDKQESSFTVHEVIKQEEKYEPLGLETIAGVSEENQALNNLSAASLSDTLQKKSGLIQEGGKQKVKFTIHEAKNLKNKRMFGSVDSYALISHGDQKFNTSVAKNSLNPQWNFRQKFK